MWLLCGHTQNPLLWNSTSPLIFSIQILLGPHKQFFVLHAGLLKLQVTTPHTFVHSHNTSSRVSHPQSTLHMWPPAWYGLLSIKLLTVQFLAKRPYLSHYTKLSVSVFSSLYNGPSPRQLPPCILFYILFSWIYYRWWKKQLCTMVILIFLGSFYTAGKEPIQQPTAVFYNRCFEWNSMNTQLHQPANRFIATH
jgi:hypothetical protein